MLILISVSFVLTGKVFEVLSTEPSRIVYVPTLIGDKVESMITRESWCPNPDFGVSFETKAEGIEWILDNIGEEYIPLHYYGREQYMHQEESDSY